MLAESNQPDSEPQVRRLAPATKPHTHTSQYSAEDKPDLQVARWRFQKTNDTDVFLQCLRFDCKPSQNLHVVPARRCQQDDRLWGTFISFPGAGRVLFSVGRGTIRTVENMMPSFYQSSSVSEMNRRLCCSSTGDGPKWKGTKHLLDSDSVSDPVLYFTVSYCLLSCYEGANSFPAIDSIASIVSSIRCLRTKHMRMSSA